MIIKIIAVALIVTLVSALLKNMGSELLPVARIAGAAVILSLAAKESAAKISAFFSYAGGLSDIGEPLSVLVKGALICAAAKITADVCRENGNASAASAVEFSARAVMLMLCMPVIEAVLKTALAFID